MLISTVNKLVVFSAPKTGSTAIHRALNGVCEICINGSPAKKHMNYKKYTRLIRPDLVQEFGQSFECFSLFREPVDWLGSWYRYRKRDSIADPRKSTADVSFNQFIEEYLRKTRKPFAQISRQSAFVSDDNGIPAIDHLFRYEKFPCAIEFLSEVFGTKIVVKKVNVSKEEALFLAPTLKRELETELSQDFDIYESL